MAWNKGLEDVLVLAGIELIFFHSSWYGAVFCICAGSTVNCTETFSLLLSITEKHQFHGMKIIFREISVSVVALCSHSIHLSVCKLLKQEMGTLLFHFQSTSPFLM